jgi:mannosyltransferase OCH1-like enzyme
VSITPATFSKRTTLVFALGLGASVLLLIVALATLACTQRFIHTIFSCLSVGTLLATSSLLYADARRLTCHSTKHGKLLTLPPPQLSQSRRTIPRVIHQVWVGPAKRKPHIEAFMKTCRDQNPTMAYRLWTNDDLTPDKFSLLHLIKNARSYAQAADIMRLEILARHGGVYLDTDFECFQPMEPILAAADAWDIGLVIAHEEPRTYEYVSNGMVMARPGHHAIASCLKHLHDHGVDLNTGEN